MVQDDQVDLEEPLNPSKQKFSKYIEDQRQISGTFGEGTNQFQIENRIKVDAACSLENMAVFQDYSCVLTNQDISYNMISEIRVFKMQLLERNDKLKWVVWTATGK